MNAADVWLRRAIAGVGCLLAVAVVGGSAVAPEAPISPATAPSVAPSGTSNPTPPAAPDPVLATGSPTGTGTGNDLGPTAAGVQRALAVPLADPRLGPRVSAIVLTSDGRVLLNRGGTAPATPASTAKLVTAITALSTIRPDDRLVTQVVAGRRPGEVVLVGGGDPTLSASRAGQRTVYPEAAKITDLARAVRRAGVGKVTRVVVDGTRYTGPRTAPGWKPEDTPSSYAAAVTAVMVDGGRARPDRLARSADPDLAAGRALAAALGAPAATVVRGTAGRAARVLGSVQSAPLLRLVEHMLQESDNVLAEALARWVAVTERRPASFAGAVAAARIVASRLGLPVTQLKLVDGSGLSTLDRVSPALLATVLRTALSGTQPNLHALVPSLPVSGYDGTLHKRYVAGATQTAAGMVRAKTGSLSGVSSLAGVAADQDGRPLVFAVVADRVPAGGMLAAEAALDRIATTLVRCGCR